MPKPTKRRSAPGKLRVRLFMWRPEIKGPQYELFHKGEWHKVNALRGARRFAAEHGYDGIQIETR